MCNYSTQLAEICLCSLQFLEMYYLFEKVVHIQPPSQINGKLCACGENGGILYQKQRN